MHHNPTRLPSPRTDSRSPKRLAEDIVRLLNVEERAATLGRPRMRERAAFRATQDAMRLARVALTRLEETK